MFAAADDQFERIDPDRNLDINSNQCTYYTIDDFNSKFSNDTGKYLLLNQNIQSFKSKQPLLEAFLESITPSFHAIVLTETWNEKKFLNLCKLDDFNAVHTYREFPDRVAQGTVGGGVSVFCNSSIYDLQKIETLSVCNMTIETCVARIFKKDNIRSEHFIVGVYRPHTDSVDNFVHALQNILSDNILANKTVVLAGDMNINLLDLNNIHVNQYLCMLNSLNYIKTIDKATRFPCGNNPIYNPS